MKEGLWNNSIAKVEIKGNQESNFRHHKFPEKLELNIFKHWTFSKICP
jgi:hypothetical protein